MQPMPSARYFRTGLATIALPAFGLTLAPSASAQSHGYAHDTTNAAPIRIPESIRAEHEEIHAALLRATKAAGEVGAAARALAAVLHPHFVREEQIALRPLGLLAPLARGKATPEMRSVLPMTDSLRAELPRMLEEHKEIANATRHVLEVARAAGDSAVVRLASQLMLHAQSEEEVFYPAAILVGDVVRARAQP
jgi:hypothetical protein